MKMKPIADFLLNLFIILFTVGMFFLFGYIVMTPYRNYFKENLACYEIHKQECEYCHSLNKTYLLCSGFCVEPEESDKNKNCAYHPEENCSNIPKMCVT